MPRNTALEEVLSKVVANIIERELGTGWSSGSDNVDAIVGLGLLSDYEWWGEDLVEVLRRKYSLTDRR